MIHINLEGRHYIVVVENGFTYYVNIGLDITIIHESKWMLCGGFGTVGSRDPDRSGIFDILDLIIEAQGEDMVSLNLFRASNGEIIAFQMGLGGSFVM
ncbi:unnamed protein product [Eruca vesicaria subsp. sativa]|uniref:Uncharacterized protein n=1 Tax=Eruca vesicaria subsp. sativa TaxID=29727 RepID=A0ABC8MA72_ERUVS|nr:unnamed protein product [Eruca vesicaria subsp. sativa]